MGYSKLNNRTVHWLAQGEITNFPCNIERGITVYQLFCIFSCGVYSIGHHTVQEKISKLFFEKSIFSQFLKSVEIAQKINI